MGSVVIYVYYLFGVELLQKLRDRRGGLEELDYSADDEVSTYDERKNLAFVFSSSMGAAILGFFTVGVVLVSMERVWTWVCRPGSRGGVLHYDLRNPTGAAATGHRKRFEAVDRSIWGQVFDMVAKALAIF